LASTGQIFSGHSSAILVSRYQPAKLAAMEGHYESGPADLHLAGWVDESAEKVWMGIKIPNFLSFLISGNFSHPVAGLKSWAKEDRPPVNIVFQSFHGMVAIGMALAFLSYLGVFYWAKGVLLRKRWLLWCFVFSVLGPQAANQLGWMVAEIGRQPWIVYGILRTSQGVSPVVSAGQVMASIVMFSFVYLLLFCLFIFLLDQKIRKGPVEIESDHDAAGHRA
jgi:cytochrome d ubiquinol oxidase subunit I